MTVKIGSKALQKKISCISRFIFGSHFFYPPKKTNGTRYQLFKLILDILQGLAIKMF